VVDDIDKDAKTHTYRWQMLTNPNHQVTIQGQTVHLSREKAPAETFVPPVADCVFLGPDQPQLAVGSTGQKRPCITATVKASNPRFAVMLYPRRTSQPCITIGMPAPEVTTAARPGGRVATATWWSVTDTILLCDGDRLTHDGIETDAAVAVVRRDPRGRLVGAIVVGGTRLHVGDVTFTSATRSTWCWDPAGARLDIARRGADLRITTARVETVRHEGRVIQARQDKQVWTVSCTAAHAH